MDTDTLNLPLLRTWIGRTERAEDVVTPRLAAELAATLNQAAPPIHGQPVPPGLHWCLAPAAAPMSTLGPDGHPARGGFLPPVTLPRRMWAGGRLEFRDTLHVGDTVERTSVISDVTAKHGRTGTLCFVTVEHEVQTRRGCAVHERQDIVYRGLPSTAAPASPPAIARAPRWTRTVAADPVLLFRYSALTFNGHRIHYDRRFCLDEEGYPGLVVHGPLQATLLMGLAAMARGAPPRLFEFRGNSPLFDTGAFTVNATVSEEPNGLDLWTAGDTEPVATSATAQW